MMVWYVVFLLKLEQEVLSIVLMGDSGDGDGLWAVCQVDAGRNVDGDATSDLSLC